MITVARVARPLAWTPEDADIIWRLRRRIEAQDWTMPGQCHAVLSMIGHDSADAVQMFARSAAHGEPGHGASL